MDAQISAADGMGQAPAVASGARRGRREGVDGRGARGRTVQLVDCVRALVDSTREDGASRVRVVLVEDLQRVEVEVAALLGLVGRRRDALEALAPQLFLELMLRERGVA